MRALGYTALEKIGVSRPADRLDRIVSRVGGRTIFDLGALDETAYLSKQDNGRWLHARLCAAAAEVVGIDTSSLVPAEGLETAPNGRIINADIFALSGVVDRYGKPDVIVAGELIEHLPNTFEFLCSLKACKELRGAEFVFSTPNACSWHNVLIGLMGRESTHADHLQIYSYKTLRTMFDRAGIELQDLMPYRVRFDEMIGNSKGATRLAARVFQVGTNMLEGVAPMLSAGWVGVARL